MRRRPVVPQNRRMHAARVELVEDSAIGSNLLFTDLEALSVC